MFSTGVAIPVRYRHMASHVESPARILPIARRAAYIPRRTSTMEGHDDPVFAPRLGDTLAAGASPAAHPNYSQHGEQSGLVKLAI